MFNPSLTDSIVAEANTAGIEPACLLALIEVETTGEPFEADGRTPRLRFEPHICFAQAAEKSKTLLAKFVAAGLAWPHADKEKASALQNTSTRRLALLAKARAIDEQVALNSCSWGLGQVMGFNAIAMGFVDARQMVDLMTDGGAIAQIRIVVKMLSQMKLVEKLNGHQWAAVARRWNGPDYASNAYDAKLAQAWTRWGRKLAAPAPSQPAPESLLSEAEIRTVQQELLAKGYFEVGVADGKWGPRTVAAINAFQEFEGLRRTGHYDEPTRVALATAGPRTVDEKRAATTAEDLKEKGSRTIKATEQLGFFAKIKMWIFGVLGIGAGAEQGGYLEQAQDVVGKVSQARDLWDSIHGLVQPLLTPQFLILCIAGFALGYSVHRLARKIAQYRTEDHRSGAHAGVS